MTFTIFTLTFLSLTFLSILQVVIADPRTLCPKKPIAAGFPLSSVPWDKYNTLTYALRKPACFVSLDIGKTADHSPDSATTPSVDNLSSDGSEPSVFPDFVSQAREHVSRYSDWGMDGRLLNK
ncbi:hypothetical protein JVU11DRAFT_2917 [Chiua virens]|nr:hypothetical protein JVU11DRAFT_2917 [Chiua virens]